MILPTIRASATYRHCSAYAITLGRLREYFQEMMAVEAYGVSASNVVSVRMS